MSIQTAKNINAILFFANKAGDVINRLKLMKLLWLADRFHLNKHGRLILKDSYVAMPHGPVPTSTMDFSRANLTDKISLEGSHDIKALDNFNPDYFSKSDLDVMTFIWETLGGLDQFQLRDLSHHFPEWIRFQKEIQDTSLPNSYGMVMEDFFNNPTEISILERYFPDSANYKKFLQTLSVENAEDSKSHYRAYMAIQNSLDSSC